MALPLARPPVPMFLQCQEVKSVIFRPCFLSTFAFDLRGYVGDGVLGRLQLALLRVSCRFFKLEKITAFHYTCAAFKAVQEAIDIAVNHDALCPF
jgi:hypothetical protein